MTTGSWTRRLDELYAKLTARERLFLVLESFRVGQPEDPRVRSTMPPDQTAEFARLAATINVVNGQLSLVIFVLGEMLERCRLLLRLHSHTPNAAECLDEAAAALETVRQALDVIEIALDDARAVLGGPDAARTDLRELLADLREVLAELSEELVARGVSPDQGPGFEELQAKVAQFYDEAWRWQIAAS